ncbi:hypothetical protein MNBD_BACTEROID07-753 [hydrothermal vent metagenome]|uniref:Uncharacterized protein n=1 Tax=hydrothermal vent metagenome TaxID=652676 RepID=A0A3B0URM7_9ZZZZ
MLLLLFSIAGQTQAQSPTFQTYVPLYDSCSKTLNFRFESSSFFKNNEYFDNYAYGYTGLGFYAKPTLEYYFSPKIKVSAGVYLLKYSGRDNFTQAIPILSVQYKMAKSLELVMGNIYGTANHQLAEPLFRYDRYFQSHIEYGLQFLLNTATIHSDLWLSWEHYIMVGDTAQEHLLAGSSSVFKVMRNRRGFSLSIPLQFLVAHKGGQLAPPPHKPMSTILNALTGAKLTYRFNNESSIDFEPQLLLYEGLHLPDPGEPNAQPFKNGWGSYTKLTFHYRGLHVLAGYWYAERFIAPHGEYLFQSVSEINPNFSQAKRELVTTKIWFNKTIYRSIKIEARFENYYDLMSHKLDYSYGLYIVMNESFFLTKYKR